MCRETARTVTLAGLIAALVAASAEAGERTERFDKDPGWEGRNNHSDAFPAADGPPGLRVQPHAACGRSSPRRDGRRPHPRGGARVLRQGDHAQDVRRQADRLGRARMRRRGGPRAGRILQRGDAQRVADPEHDRPAHPGAGRQVLRLRRVRHEPMARGGDSPGPFAQVRDPKTGKDEPRGFALKTPHTWSLTYDPHGNDGRGVVTATIDGETSVCHLDRGPQGRRGLVRPIRPARRDEERRQPGRALARRRLRRRHPRSTSTETRGGNRSGTVAPTCRRTCVRASTSVTAPPTSPAARPRVSSGAWSSAATSARPHGWPPTAIGSARSRSTGR